MLVGRVTPDHGVDLGDGDDSRRDLVRRGVHLLQELHCFQVLPAAVDVGGPAALGSRVV